MAHNTQRQVYPLRRRSRLFWTGGEPLFGLGLTGCREDGEITVRSIIERRLRVLRELPRMIPASIVLEMSDADLDALAAAVPRGAYWRCLSAVVSRIEAKDPAEEWR